MACRRFEAWLHPQALSGVTAGRQPYAARADRGFRADSRRERQAVCRQAGAVEFQALLEQTVKTIHRADGIFLGNVRVATSAVKADGTQPIGEAVNDAQILRRCSGGDAKHSFTAK